MTDAHRIGLGTSKTCDRFIEWMNLCNWPSILEFGTRRADPEVPTHHREWMHGPCTYTMADIEPGLDVDLVLDACDDYRGWAPMIVIAVATWEHIATPWIAAQRLADALPRGGGAYISTHHTFPEHAYPSDYTRWSRDGLAAMFESVGLATVSTSYMYPCDIVPHGADELGGREFVTRWNPAAPAWLCVDGFFRKL